MEIDLTLILVALIPTLGGLIAYFFKINDAKQNRKMKIIEEYQQYFSMLIIYYNRFTNRIINKYCINKKIYSRVITSQTICDYILREKPNSKIDLFKHFDELRDNALKLKEKNNTPYSIMGTNPKIKYLSDYSDSAYSLINFLFKRIIEERSENIIYDIYLVQANLNDLHSLELSIMVEKTFLIDNFLLRQLKYFIIKNKKKFFKEKPITRNNQL